MKLVYVAGSRIPSDTANSVHVLRMCEALANLGHEVTLLAKQGAEEVDDVFQHYGIATRFRLVVAPFNNRTGLLGYLRRFSGLPPADLVVGRYLYALLWAQARGQRTVYESHMPATGARRRLERWYFLRPGVQRHVVITEALRRHYDETTHSTPAGGRLVIPDAAVDPGPLEPMDAGSGLVIGYAGGFYPGRGLELIGQLAAQLPQHRFRLAGGGAEALRSFGFEQADNVDCVGYLPHGRVAEFLAPCDILVAPYQDRITVHGASGDTAAFFSPMKLFEYMALGKAILCSDLPVLHEVFDEQVGVFVPSSDVQAWADAIVRLDDDRNRLRALGERARLRFLDRHTWEQRAQRVLAGLPV